jgi:hypothetical protein
MNTEGTDSYKCKECYNTESLSNHTTTVHKEREELENRRNAGEISCNSGDGTGQMAQPLMFMMDRFMTSQHTNFVLSLIGGIKYPNREAYKPQNQKAQTALLLIYRSFYTGFIKIIGEV